MLHLRSIHSCFHMFMCLSRRRHKELHFYSQAQCHCQAQAGSVKERLLALASLALQQERVPCFWLLLRISRDIQRRQPGQRVLSIPGPAGQRKQRCYGRASQKCVEQHSEIVLNIACRQVAEQ